MIGILASVTGLFLGLGLAKGLFSCSSRSASRCRTAASSSRRAPSIVSLLAGILVTLIASLRPAIRATRVRRSRRCARARCCPRRGSPASDARRRSSRLSASLALLLFGLFDRRLGRPAAPRDRARRAPASSSASRCSPSARAAARLDARLARDSRRRRRRARSRAKRDAQSRAHCFDRGRADDRPRARHAGRRCSQRASRRVRRRGRHQAVPRRLCDHRAEQLHADRRRLGAGAAAGAERPGRRPASARARAGRSARRSSRPASSPTRPLFKLDWSRAARRRRSPRSGTTARSSTRDYAKSHHLVVGSPIPLSFPTGETAARHVQRHLRSPGGGSPFGNVTISHEPVTASTRTRRTSSPSSHGRAA